ncbi:MAG: GNAT family N-acetyltransferase [Bacilli bacterium]|nr:GNAT family N-acetyltransferase [Bacilli bacterium]
MRYYEIVKKYNPNVKPLATKETFDEYIKGIERRVNGVDNGIFIHDYYLMENDDIIGLCCLIINPEDDKDLYDYTGNVSYIIRPDKRQKGYGSVCLHLLIEEANKLGLDDITVYCTEDNIGSRKIIENNEGKLVGQNVYMDETDTDMINYGKNNLKFVINIKESLTKFLKIK